jgi:hypothetical protein
MITDHEKKIIDDAISMSFQRLGGVRTMVDPEGYTMTNYVPFRKHFRAHPYTKGHCQHAIKSYKDAVKMIMGEC